MDVCARLLQALRVDVEATRLDAEPARRRHRDPAIAAAEVPEDVVRLESSEVQQRLDRFLRCRLIQHVWDALAGRPRPEIDRFEVARPYIDAMSDGLWTIRARNDRLDGVSVLPRYQRRRFEAAH